MIRSQLERRNRSRWVVMLFVVLPLLSAVDDPRRQAAALVDEGLAHFGNDQFADAEASFAAALELVPENDVVLFDKGCAALSAGNREPARSLFRSVTLTKDGRMAARAHYNLGSLESTEARELLGEEPAAAEGDVRTQSLERLRAAAQQFRSALRRESDHTQARHNLELIQLYIKHLQSQWQERDRQKNRDEKDLLQFLKMIEDRQTELRDVTRRLAEDAADAAVSSPGTGNGGNAGATPPSPSRFARQAAWETAVALRTLQEEIDPLKQKISTEVTAADPAASPAGDQSASPERLLHEIADRMGGQLLQAAEELEALQGQPSVDSQTAGLALTNDLYTAIVPYPDLLRRAIETQTQWVPDETQETIETPAESSALDPEVSDGTATTTPPADTPESGLPSTAADVSLAGGPISPDHLEAQQRVSMWSTALKYKAEASLPQVEQQLQQLPPAANGSPDVASAAPDPTTNNDEGATEADNSVATLDPSDEDADDNSGQSADAEDPAVAQRKQLEGLAESMRLAIDLAPQAEAESVLAASDLEGDRRDAALPHQKSTLRILQEIAEPLQDDSNNNENQDQEQDQNDSGDSENNEDQNQQSEENQDSSQNDSDNDSDNEGEEESDKQDPSQPDSQPQPDKQPSSEQERQQQQESRRQRAESILRQAAERERDYREQQKRIRALLQRGYKVDRDW